LICLTEKAQAYSVYALKCSGSVQLLDFFEGSKLRQFEYPATLENASTTNDEILLRKLAQRLPDQAQQITDHFGDFDQQVTFLDSPNWPEAPSSDMILKPIPSCQIVTVIKTENFQTTFVDKTLWQQLNPLEKSIAKLSWFLGNLASKSTQSSIYIRALLALLPQTDFITLSNLRFADVCLMAGIDQLRLQGVVIDLNKPLQWNDDENHLVSGYSVDQSTWLYNKSQINLKPSLVTFYPDGVVKSLRYYGQININLHDQVIPLETPNDFFIDKLESDLEPLATFTEDGRLKSALVLQPSFYKDDRFDVQFAQNKLVYQSQLNTSIEFFNSGEIQTLTRTSGRINWNGRWINLQSGFSVLSYSEKKFAEFVTTDNLRVKLQGKDIAVSGYVAFSEDGMLTRGTLVESVVLQTTKGERLVFSAGDSLIVSKDGRVFVGTNVLN